jgi:hypothetical protein
MGEGSEAPFAAALEAISEMMLRNPQASGNVERTIDELRKIDASALLSRALLFVAASDFEAGNLQETAARANEALSAAEQVGRRSEIVLARSILAQVALASGDTAGALQQAKLVSSDLKEPHLIAAHARRAAQAVLRSSAISNGISNGRFNGPSLD